MILPETCPASELQVKRSQILNRRGRFVSEDTLCEEMIVAHQGDIHLARRRRRVQELRTLEPGEHGRNLSSTRLRSQHTLNPNALYKPRVADLRAVATSSRWQCRSGEQLTAEFEALLKQVNGTLEDH